MDGEVSATERLLARHTVPTRATRNYSLGHDPKPERIVNLQLASACSREVKVNDEVVDDGLSRRATPPRIRKRSASTRPSLTVSCFTGFTATLSLWFRVADARHGVHRHCEHTCEHTYHTLRAIPSRIIIPTLPDVSADRLGEGDARTRPANRLPGLGRTRPILVDEIKRSTLEHPRDPSPPGVASISTPLRPCVTFVYRYNTAFTPRQEYAAGKIALPT